MQSRPTDNLQSIKTEPLNITTELSPRQDEKNCTPAFYPISSHRPEMNNPQHHIRPLPIKHYSYRHFISPGSGTPGLVK